MKRTTYYQGDCHDSMDDCGRVILSPAFAWGSNKRASGRRQPRGKGNEGQRAQVSKGRGRQSASKRAWEFNGAGTVDERRCAERAGSRPSRQARQKQQPTVAKFRNNRGDRLGFALPGFDCSRRWDSRERTTAR